MKYIKLFEYYTDVDTICTQYEIKNYTVNNKGLVDIDGSVHLYNKGLSKLPLKFGNVSGVFDCRDNQLKSLNGCPENVGIHFYCSHNKLTSLEYCPKYIASIFICSDNQLASLKGCPDKIDDNFSCSFNKLKTLKYFPEVNGEIYITGNPLPVEIRNNKKYFNEIIRNQYEYGIWNKNDTLNLPRFELMMEEIKSNN